MPTLIKRSLSHQANKIAIVFVILILSIFPVVGQDEPSVLTAHISWSPDGQYIAVAANNQVDIVEVSTQQISHTFVTDGVMLTLTEPIWSPDGQRIGFSNGEYFEIWSGPTDNPILQARYPAFVGSQAGSWSPDGQVIALSNGEQTDFWDASTHTLLFTYAAGLTSWQVWSLDWNKDNQTILIGDGRFTVIFDYDAGTPRSIFDVSQFVNSRGFYVTPVVYSAWSPSQDQIALASDDAVRIIDLQDYLDQEYVIIDFNSPLFWGHQGQVYSVDWHPGGKFLASGGADGTIRIWDVETGQQINIIEFPDNLMVQSVAWSPDGTQLAYGSPTGGPEVVIVPSSDLLPLTAHAGPDQTLTADASGFATVTLDGSASFDPDGEIVSYVWTLDGVEIATGVSPAVTLEVGEHVITLTVTDDDGMSASDTVTITVVAASTPTPTVTITPTDTPTATLTPTYTPTPSQVCDFNVAAGDALGLVNAINAANSNGDSADTICLEDSTYTFLSASNSIALPSVTTPITIVGNGAIIERGSGAPNFRLFNVTSSGALTLEDMTIRNGNASGNNGGAILNAGSLTLDGVTLANNSARFGGGIHSSGSLVISDSTLVTNSAVENGGAVYVSSGSLTLSDTILEENSARYGSGVYLNNGTADLTGVIARANHATEQGAGVYQRTGTLTISGGLFENNTARFGNGVYVDAGTAAISDVTMRENVAVEEGAGIYNRTGTVSVTDSIFGDNQARYGAAISNRGTLSVAGSVFTGNNVQESGGAVYTTMSTSSNQVQQSCFEGNTGRFGAAVFSSASGFNARDNWWGATTGPTGAMVNANVLTAPFLTDGCPQ